MDTTKELTQFRTRLYRSLPGRGDALMDLLDALASNQSAQSAVELSLSPAFRRSWSSVSKAIARFLEASSDWVAAGERAKLERRVVRETQSLLEAPKRRGHWLFGVDATPMSRPYAACLTDRSWVHQCDAPSTGAPVTIGHQYAVRARSTSRNPTSFASTPDLQDTPTFIRGGVRVACTWQTQSMTSRPRSWPSSTTTTGLSPSPAHGPSTASHSQCNYRATCARLY